MEVPQILELIAKAGPLGLAAVFALLWNLERRERIESQARERALSKTTLTSMNRTTNALRTLRAVLLHGREPEPDEYEAEELPDAGNEG